MIINFTQHSPTAEQIAVGVIDPIPADVRNKVLTFTGIPSSEDVRTRAMEAATVISEVAEKGTKVMIGGAPFFMGALESALKIAGYIPVYAFSERVSVDVPQEDGSVVKTAKFVHKGFVEA